MVRGSTSKCPDLRVNLSSVRSLNNTDFTLGTEKTGDLDKEESRRLGLVRVL